MIRIEKRPKHNTKRNTNQQGAHQEICTHNRQNHHPCRNDRIIKNENNGVNTQPTKNNIAHTTPRPQQKKIYKTQTREAINNKS